MFEALLEKLLPAGSFARNVSVLVTGTTVAQGITVLALPLLTRMYSPEDFALLALYAALLGVFTTISCMRYNIAIAIPENDVDAISLLGVSLYSALFFSIIIALPVIFLPEQITLSLNQPSFGNYLWLIPIGVLVAGFYNALQYWASRKKRFGLVARTRLTRSLGGTGVQLGYGAFQPSALGLIFGHMIYGGMGIIGLSVNLWKNDRNALQKLTLSRMIGQASSYRRFPIWSAPEALFNVAGVQLPIILIAAGAIGPEAGFLFLAMRVMGLPMGLIGASVSQAFLVEGPSRLKEGTLFAFTRSTMLTMFKIGGPMIIVTGLVSPLVFPLAFGDEWARAGWLMAWMMPWFVLQFVASPVSVALYILGRQKEALLLQVVGCAMRVGAVLMTIELLPEYVSESYAVSGALFYGLYIMVIMRFTKADREVVKE